MLNIPSAESNQGDNKPFTCLANTLIRCCVSLFRGTLYFSDNLFSAPNHLSMVRSACSTLSMYCTVYLPTSRQALLCLSREFIYIQLLLDCRCIILEAHHMTVLYFTETPTL